MIPPLVLVDSSYFITWHAKGLNPFARLDRHKAIYDFAINGIVWGEVIRGRSDPNVRDRYEEAFSLTRMLHLAPSGWERVARLAWELDRHGEVIPLTDLIIGVTALEHQACVLTFDRHYKRIPGLISVSDLE